MTASMFWASDPEQYAGFWSRLGAQILDGLIVLPAVALRMLLFRTKASAVFSVVPLLLFDFWFFVYLVYRYGGTPGKLLLGIRITSANGDPLKLKQAVLRHAPSIGLSLISAVGLAIALSRVSDSTYEGTSWLNRGRLIAVFSPRWIGWVRFVSELWFWSELVVMLTNPEKRALHDFIAGTIVIKQEYVPPIEGAARHSAPAVP